MPAMSNAHDHGRGLRPLSYGAFDQPLETWFTALNVHPPVDPYLNAALAFSRMARSGIGLVVHCHMARSAATLIEDAVAVCRAAQDVGIRLAFVVPMRDRGRLGYFPDEVVLSRLSVECRRAVESRWLGGILPVGEQIALVEEIARRCESDLVSVLYGPAAPHWCTNHLLEQVAEASALNGRRIHMHCLETGFQREFADAAFDEGLFPYLQRIGLLTDRLTLAHGVCLRSEEMDMIAEAGCVVSLNTCSNLRLHSGIAPAREMAARGVPLAIGIDALGLDDTEDGLRELRLTRLLHGGVGFEPGLSGEYLFTCATTNGARAVTGRPGKAGLAAGGAADIALVDFDGMSRDVLPGTTPDLEILLARGQAQYISSLWVNGEEVVRQGALVNIDFEAIESELISQARHSADDYLAALPTLQALQSALKSCYRDGLHKSG